MRRFERRLAIFGTLLLFAALVGGCGTSGKKEGQIGTAQTSSVVVQKGDSVIAGASGYIGSAACASCHPNQFAGWGNSLHNAPLKTVAELGDAIFVNDANNNDVNDFKEGLDLNDPATDSLITSSVADNLFALRPNAPVLSFSGGKFYMTLGAVRYEVQRTQGGNGYWKQRYQTRIGKSYYILPLQFNESTKQYVAYSQGNWYTGAAPRLTQSYGSDELVAQLATYNTPVTKKGASVSWENRCAGCHQTGLTLEKQTTTYAGTPVDEAVTGYTELNIGCESCHGPGAAHAASRNPADIVNPDNFKALGVAGLRQANMVCGRCHSRGEGNFTLAGMNLDTEYYANSSGQFPVPGNNFIDNSAGNPFAILNTSTAYYGAGAATGSTDPAVASWYANWYNGFGFTYNFPTYVAAKQHHQQWTDMEQGPHGTDKASDVTCWSCHDPHQASGDHQVRDTIVESGVTIRTRNDDDSLCLACHAGSGDFAGLTKTQVATIASGNPDPAIATGVSAHSGHSFNPTASGNDAASRCSGCHMPSTAKSAVSNDIHNHTFLIIRPSLSKSTSGSTAGVRNACDKCHPVGDTRIDPSGALTGDAYLDALQAAYDVKFP